MNFCSFTAALIAFPVCFLGRPIIVLPRWNAAGPASLRAGRKSRRALGSWCSCSGACIVPMVAVTGAVAARGHTRPCFAAGAGLSVFRGARLLLPERNGTPEPLSVARCWGCWRHTALILRRAGENQAQCLRSHISCSHGQQDARRHGRALESREHCPSLLALFASC